MPRLGLGSALIGGAIIGAAGGAVIWLVGKLR